MNHPVPCRRTMGVLRHLPSGVWGYPVAGPLVFLTGCQISSHSTRLQSDPRMLGLFAVIVVLAVLMLLASNRQRQRRTQALSIWAEQMGFTLHKQGCIFAELQGFSVFRQFRRQSKIRNIVHGRRATGEFIIFDYTVGRPTSPPQAPVSIFTYTIAAFRLASAALPAFAMSPAVLHSTPGILRSVLFKEIGFESCPGFSRRFSVRIKEKRDEHAVRTLFSSSSLSSFETFDPGHNWSVEGEGEWLIAYRWREEVSAEQYADFFHNSGSIADYFLAAHTMNL